MAQATTTTSDDKEKQEQKVDVEFFHIDIKILCSREY